MVNICMDAMLHVITLFVYIQVNSIGTFVRLIQSINQRLFNNNNNFKQQT